MGAFRHAQAIAARARRRCSGICILRPLCYRRSESKRNIHGVDGIPPFRVHTEVMLSIHLSLCSDHFDHDFIVLRRRRPPKLDGPLQSA